MRARRQSGLVAVVLVCTVMSVSEAADITGSYSCQGVNPDGSTYAGTLKISSSGEGYWLEWTVSGQKSTGVGILSDGHLGSTYGSNGLYGIVLYKLEGDGRLVGKWVGAYGGKSGTETDTPHR